MLKKRLLLIMIVWTKKVSVKEDIPSKKEFHYKKDHLSKEEFNYEKDLSSKEEPLLTEIQQEWPLKPSCIPKRNMVYLKTHKTASSTVQNIILRYALRENLIVMEPGNGHDFNYPGRFSPKRGTQPGKSNLICHHARFDYDRMRSVMPTDDVVWVASVREPLSLYKSTINYFRPILPAFRRIQPGEPVEKWFDSAELFVRTSARSAYDHFAHSHMFFDFGFDNKRDDDQYIGEALRRLDEIFDLVVVSDHFDESMVLLSDLLCWPIADFASLTLNARKTNQKVDEVAEERVRKKVRAWNKADAALFDHYNATLWRKVDEYGRERMDEQLRLLHAERDRLSEKCLAGDEPVEVSSMKDAKQRNAFYRPAGVKLTGYELRDDAKHDDTCRHLVQPENQFSAEVFKMQRGL